MTMSQLIKGEVGSRLSLKNDAILYQSMTNMAGLALHQ